uniref:NAD(P)(+)--arginine ADP-ribosyltransferase n=1 Tax=Hucho hucho TaxID=62062 RepID=A0A4W5NK47_9TELE
LHDSLCHAYKVLPLSLPFSEDSSLNSRNPNPTPLDMAPDSIDDSYEGCRENMLCEVTNNFRPKEKKKYRKCQLNPTEIIFEPFNEATTLGKHYKTVYKYHSLHFLLSDALQTFHGTHWKTCFKITTCFGASLAGLSQVNNEEEVLIPPYEVFKIAEVTKNKVLEDKDKDDKSECEIVYELESTKTTKSDLNCRKRPKITKPVTPCNT